MCRQCASLSFSCFCCSCLCCTRPRCTRPAGDTRLGGGAAGPVVAQPLSSLSQPSPRCPEQTGTPQITHLQPSSPPGLRPSAPPGWTAHLGANPSVWPGPMPGQRQ
uniref:ORF3 n=1 Tax=Rocahepevirus ratti TaxID=1678145 RepID=A0A2P1MBR4_9VIRU|nr:ORF3 [Rocahepevirus ratti]